MITLKDLVTVVIPCKNEERYIENTLASISMQKGSDGLRVIIADAHSTDKTLDVINECKKKFANLRIEVIEGGTVAVGRNRGGSLVETIYVLFIDADTGLTGFDTLRMGVEKMTRYSLVTCNLQSSVRSLKSRMMFASFNFIRKWIMQEPFATGVFFLVKTHDFKKLGGFDETVTTSEDYLLSRKYAIHEFCVLPRYATQDDRRFRHMGYWGFLKMLVSNWINRNDINHFRKDVNYWK